MKNILKIIVIVFISVAFVVIMLSCKKDKATPPILTTAEPSEITQKTVTCGGNITSDGGEEIIIAGICWSTSANPSIKDKHTNDAKEPGSFTSKLTGLVPDTKHFIRAYAYNKAGAGYGNEVTFTTSPIALATLTTSDVTSITSNSAISGGNITDDGGGIITARGVCWAKYANPTVTGEHTTDGTGTGGFISNINCLSFATTYYVRAYAINSAGTTYGDQQIFTTPGTNPIIFNPDLTYGSVSDLDGNCYKTIQIGTQTWMAENLKTTKYNNGDLIGTTTPMELDISNESTPSYQWSYSESHTAVYGRWYTWYAVTDTRNVCPTGWHVPSNVEWTTLIDYFGETSVAYDKLRESGNTHWRYCMSAPDVSNENGFTALPGGIRPPSFYDHYIGEMGNFWSTTEYDVLSARSLDLGFCFGELSQSTTSKKYGLSIRCLKD